MFFSSSLSKCKYLGQLRLQITLETELFNKKAPFIKVLASDQNVFRKAFNKIFFQITIYTSFEFLLTFGPL